MGSIIIMLQRWCFVDFSSSDAVPVNFFSRSLVDRCRLVVWMCGQIIGSFVIKQIKKPQLCSVLLWRTLVEQSRREKHLTKSSVFPYTSFVLCHFLCATEQSTVEASLFVKCPPSYKCFCYFDYVFCFSLHFFRALPLPVCFTTEQSTVEASLFVKCPPSYKCFCYFWTFKDV